MLPRLEAEESLLAAQRTAVGSGTAGNTGTQIAQKWAQAANVGQPQLKQKPTKKDLRGLGIGSRPWPKPHGD
jgi:hypothetical protein